MTILTQHDIERLNYYKRRVDLKKIPYEQERYKFAQMIEQLVAMEYDTDKFMTDAEVNELLDWKSDYEIAQAQAEAAKRERFAMTDAIRASK